MESTRGNWTCIALAVILASAPPVSLAEAPAQDTGDARHSLARDRCGDGAMPALQEAQGQLASHLIGKGPELHLPRMSPRLPVTRDQQDLIGLALAFRPHAG